MNALAEKKGVEQSEELKRLDVVVVDLGENTGSIQSGVRPCLVLGNDRGNKFSPVVIVAPVTSKVKKPMPTHVRVEAEKVGMAEDSVILFEQIITISKEQIMFKLFDLPQYYHGSVERAIKVSLGL